MDFLMAASHAISWEALTALVIGVLIGDIFGMIPGLEASMAMAIVLPFTLYWDPVFSIAFLVGMYKGGCFAGSTTAILLGTTGSAESAAALLDGRPMALKGQAGKALRMALLSSVTGDFVASIFLIIGVAVITPIALSMGPAEHFAFLLLSLTTIGMISPGSNIKAMAAASLGLLIGCIGYDPIESVPRFQFGQFELAAGIGIVPFIIGFMCVSAILFRLDQEASRKARGVISKELPEVPGGSSLSWSEYASCLPTLLRAGIIGVISGILPGHGAAGAAFTSYAINRRFSNRGRYYGTGELDGVAAAQCADSATSGPTLVPLLTLGIPGSGTAAIFGAALILKGIQPGPLIMEQHPEVVYGIYTLFFLGTFANLGVGILLRMYLHKIMLAPSHYLFPGALAMSILGTYTVNHNIFDVYAMLVAGVIGYFLRKGGYPFAPLVMAFLLGPMCENSFRQSMLIFDNNPLKFLDRPIVIGCLALSLFVIVASVPFLWTHTFGWIGRLTHRATPNG